MKRRIIALLFAGVISALPLTACADDAASSEVKWANEDAPNTEVTDETLVVGLSSEPSGIWMGGTTNVENEMVIVEHAIMDGLVSLDQRTGEVVPCLAKEWEWVDDTHCKFYLREDAIMTDGTPLVADDVVYTVNTAMEYSPSTDTGRFFVGAVADDEHTVTIEFNAVAPDFLNMLTWANFGIVSEDEINALGGVEAAVTNPVCGCGKYRFKEWAPREYITLERNDNYWNPDYRGYYKEIKLNFVNDSASRTLAVRSGDFQVAVDVPMSMAATYQDSEDVNLIISSMGNTTRLWYNMGPNAGATADLKVRQAIDKALDFDAIAYIGTAGFGGEIHGYFPEESKFYNETFTKEERTRDIEGAKALLEEAGYGDGLSLNIIGTQDAEPVFTVIQANLKEAGIDLAINIMDVAQFVEQSNGGTYDLILVGDSVDARYPSIMVFFRQASIDTFCIGGSKWTTPEIEEKIEALVRESDEAKAKAIGAELENIYKENMCFSNAYSELRSSLTAKDIKGYCTTERGMVDLTQFYK